MIVQEGKFYKTRDGRKLGPLMPDAPGYLCHDMDGNTKSFHIRTGKNVVDPHLDLIAEWTEGPVRTVTRREVVAGQYAYVDVNGVGSDCAGKGQVNVHLDAMLNATELKAAAAVLLELAGALDSE